MHQLMTQRAIPAPLRGSGARAHPFQLRPPDGQYRRTGVAWTL